MDSPRGSQKSLDGFGAKDITMLASVALLFNNITGAAMVEMPVLFQQAGWLTPTLAMLFILLVSSYASTMLVEAMASIPGNEHLENRVELSGLAKYWFAPWAYWSTQVLLNLSLLALNVSNIIVSAQTMDFTLVALFDYSCAIELLPHPGFVHVSEAGSSISPFSGIVVSLGFVIVLLLTIPMGYFNLDDNMWLQQGAFVLTLAIVLQWLCEFVYFGLDTAHVPLLGADQSQVLGTTIFNYAYVITVPSWINELEGGVSVHKSIWIGSLLATFVYVLLGYVGGRALVFTADQTLLDALDAATHGTLHVATQITTYSFPFIAFLSSIPVYSIVVRYNLLESNFCSKGWANFWGVCFPWLLSIPFCTGAGFSTFLNWSALLVNGLINFVIPIALYIVIKLPNNQAPSLKTHVQIQIQHDSDLDHEEERTATATATSVVSTDRKQLTDIDSGETHLLLHDSLTVPRSDASFEHHEPEFNAFPFTDTQFWEDHIEPHFRRENMVYIAMAMAVLVGGINLMVVLMSLLRFIASFFE